MDGGEESKRSSNSRFDLLPLTATRARLARFDSARFFFLSAGASGEEPGEGEEEVGEAARTFTAWKTCIGGVRLLCSSGIQIGSAPEGPRLGDQSLRKRIGGLSHESQPVLLAKCALTVTSDNNSFDSRKLERRSAKQEREDQGPGFSRQRRESHPSQSKPSPTSDLCPSVD